MYTLKYRKRHKKTVGLFPTPFEENDYHLFIYLLFYLLRACDL